MTVKEFISKLEDLGFDDNTEFRIGLFGIEGEWYDLCFELDDEDRQMIPDMNEICMTIELDDNAMNKEMRIVFQEDLETLRDMIDNQIYKFQQHIGKVR